MRPGVSMGLRATGAAVAPALRATVAGVSAAVGETARHADFLSTGDKTSLSKGCVREPRPGRNDPLANRAGAVSRCAASIADVGRTGSDVTPPRTAVCLTAIPTARSPDGCAATLTGAEASEGLTGCSPSAARPKRGRPRAGCPAYGRAAALVGRAASRGCDSASAAASVTASLPRPPAGVARSGSAATVLPDRILGAPVNPARLVAAAAIVGREAASSTRDGRSGQSTTSRSGPRVCSPGPAASLAPVVAVSLTQGLLGARLANRAVGAAGRRGGLDTGENHSPLALAAASVGGAGRACGVGVTPGLAAAVTGLDVGFSAGLAAIIGAEPCWAA